jgi:large subunit ribosomal protein L9
MQIILLEKIKNLGGLGDSVDVRPGYARNFLIPSGKAITANEVNLAEFESRRADLEQQQAEVVNAAKVRAAKLENLTIVLAHRAGEEGKLFGSVGAADVATAITAMVGTEIDRTEVRIADSIRQVGEYTVEIHLHPDVNVDITLDVQAAQA